MVAVIGKSMFYLLLTAGLQYVGLWFRDWPNSERDFLQLFFSCIIPVGLTVLAFREWRKIGAFKKRAWMAEHPDSFSPDKIDCYVRFTGKIAAAQTHRLPFSGKECAYCLATVVAEWETKKKKPANGLETQRKPLLREQSAAELELTDKAGKVYVKAEDFTKNWLALRSTEKTQGSCPAAAATQDMRKYKRYQVAEQFLLQGDTVVAQGRLALNRDGRLFIKPTRRLEFPSFVALLPARSKAPDLLQTIASKARSDAWDRRIRTVLLPVNALLLLYFWF